MDNRINHPVAIQHCKGMEACPNSVMEKGQVEKLVSAIEEITVNTQTNKSYSGDAVPHHRKFFISVSMCPNACSRPQIADIGLIGALIPKTKPGLCSGCNLCVRTCREEAIRINSPNIPAISKECLYCGACVSVCGTGALIPAQTGFRIQLGGKLGRHPSLGRELPGIYSINEAKDIIHFCYNFYLKNCEKNGMRFGDYIGKYGISWIPEHLISKNGHSVKNAASELVT